MVLTTAEMAKVLAKIATAPEDVRAIYNSVLLSISERQDGLSKLFLTVAEEVGAMKSLLQAALADDVAPAPIGPVGAGNTPPSQGGSTTTAPVEGEDDGEMMPMHNASRVVNTTQTPVKPPNVVSQQPNGAKS